MLSKAMRFSNAKTETSGSKWIPRLLSYSKPLISLVLRTSLIKLSSRIPRASFNRKLMN